MRAQDLRHEADCDLNASLTERDARVLIKSVQDAADAWRAAGSAAHRDFKQALSLLILLKGRLRSDDG